MGKERVLKQQKIEKLNIIISLQNVIKIYDGGSQETVALNDVSIDISEGDMVVIFGPSGSGKTTLLNLIGGLDRPTSGKLIIDGKDITAFNNNELNIYRRTKIGFIFQFFNLFDSLTAAENVKLALELVEKDKKKLNKRAVELLEWVGLGDKINNFPGELSGGQQQRVAIARAISKGNRIILADEPTGNLDSKTGKRVLNIMHELNHEHGMTFVIVTHDLSIQKIADKIIELKDGRIKLIRNGFDG
jgi:putative ABC transport system ATP-binding protein